MLHDKCIKLQAVHTTPEMQPKKKKKVLVRPLSNSQY